MPVTMMVSAALETPIELTRSSMLLVPYTRYNSISTQTEPK